MSLATIEADITTGIHDGIGKAEDLLEHFRALAEDKLPEFATVAKTAAGNPLVDAALSAVHLSPELLTTLAAVITKADADLAAAGVPAADGAESDGEPPAGPAEPGAPAEVPQPVAAGPTVGGAAT
jgi:hypothetical protein